MLDAQQLKVQYVLEELEKKKRKYSTRPNDAEFVDQKRLYETTINLIRDLHHATNMSDIKCNNCPHISVETGNPNVNHTNKGSLVYLSEDAAQWFGNNGKYIFFKKKEAIDAFIASGFEND